MKTPYPQPPVDISSLSSAIAPETETPLSPTQIQPDLQVYTEVLEQVLEKSTHCPEAFPDSCTQEMGGSPAPASSPAAEWQIFLSTFATIFLAEVGDKTQLTVLLMSAQSHAPWVVFVGAGAALIATSLCGVLLGKWLSQLLSPKTLETSAGLLLLGIALLLFWDVLNG